MNNLISLTAERITQILPSECIEKLIEPYFKDRIYDLSTYVETKVKPENGYFVVFMEVNNSITCAGITTHPVGLCSKNNGICEGISFHAYWIPETKFNAMIIVEDPKSRKTQVRYSFYDQPSSTAIMTIPREIRRLAEYDMGWESQGNHMISLNYWIPPH